jgi:splicing factor 3B subunit 3
MYLYSLSLQPPTAINRVICGHFSGGKSEEICIAKGRILELLRPNPTSKKLVSIYTQEVFGVVRKIVPFRLTGFTKDFIVVGSDSGRIVILEYIPETNSFVKVHQETFGKTGVRRTTPGDYVAGDPKGRAVMVGGIEKMKFVYILNRDSENKLTISSPLEAHKAHTILFDMVALDAGYDNPLFACIEVDFGDEDTPSSAINTGKYTKLLTLYEMDLGLNHVVRRHADPLDESAHLLISVPGTPDGPGGVLVCSNNCITYKKVSHVELKCPLPVRYGLEAEPMFISCAATHSGKDYFFFLVQNSKGDLYTVQLRHTNESVHGITVQYFDTIPPATGMCITKNGFLFAASEFGDHALYKFKLSWEDDKESAKTFSTTPLDTIERFHVRKLKNLIKTDDIASSTLISQIRVEDLVDEGEPQIYALCGKADRSVLRVFRHGLSIAERANSTMPTNPSGVWTLKKSLEDKFDHYLIVSFVDATLVLSIGEKVVEVPKTGLDITQGTIHVGLMEDGSMIQVCKNKILHIRKSGKIVMWQTTGTIIQASSNERQLVVSLRGGELIYFELDETDQLSEVEKKFLDNETVCLGLGSIPVGRKRCPFLAVGENDKTVKILSLDPESCLSRISMQVLPGPVSSVCLIEMQDTNHSEELQLYLHVGLINGVLLRTAVDSITGALSDPRTRFLGTRPIQLLKAKINGQPGMVALSSKTWLCYNYMSKYMATPLTTDGFEFASNFASELCAEGIVGTRGNTLRIIGLERLGEVFSQTVVPLTYTPRRMLIDDQTKNLLILEADHRCYTTEERKKIREELIARYPDKEYEELTEQEIGYPQAPSGTWASCLRIMSPKDLKTIELIEFVDKEVVLSMAFITFEEHQKDTYLVLGSAKNFVLHPRSCEAAYITLYKFTEGKNMDLVYKMPVEDLPLAFLEFKGQMLAGVGNVLRLYALGMKKLLKKCENKSFSSPISSIVACQNRIFVSDTSESIHVLKYKKEENQLYLFADDVLPRWVTSFTLLDFDTIAGVDKFENVFVLRLPPGCDEEADEDPTASKFKWESGYLNGAAFKMEQICQYHIGDVATSIQKVRLASGANECLVYGTAMGGLGVLVPFETREEVDFFVHFEMYLRLENLSVVGRDHLSYRSYYVPVKDVIDGDLCEEYGKLGYKQQKSLSDELDRSTSEIIKKLEDMRNKIM